MKQAFLKYLLSLTAFLMAFSVMAQQFATHAVKEGETLTSIAKQYKVTPYNILKHNSEIKQGDVLKPNTILVIPLDANASDTGVKGNKRPAISGATKKEIVQEEPIGFSSHKVRKRETLFGISKRYNITEEDIKRYNTKLYASQLKKGMRLKIPKYRVVDPSENEINPDNYETYTVKPKETRWSIAHTYGITIDSLLVLNPDLPRSNNSLAVGQELQLPKMAGSSVEDQNVQLYESYTVPPKKTIYSLSKEYEVSSEDIVRLNPEIVERGGLKEGMVIRLPKKTIKTGEVNTDNFIFYEVKPKQTEYSLTRNLNMTYRELLDLNPDLSAGLKAGMVLKLPKSKAAELEVRNSLVLDKINLLDSINRVHKPKLVYLLPFRLDKIKLEDAESAKKAIKRSNAIKYSLGLYSGAMVAIDSIASLGVSVDVKTFDTQLSLDRTRLILSGQDLADVSAIVGPLQLNSLKEVAVQASKYQVPVVAPLTAESDISLDNVFFTIPSEEVLRARMLVHVESIYEDQNIIIITDEKNREVEGQILEKFPAANIVELKEEEKNVGINIDLFTAILSEERENWVFLETENFKVVSSVTSILNSSNTALTKVRMFTTDKNKAFENDVISGSHLSNLNFTYPSVDKEMGNDAFVRRYRKKYGSDPDRYAIRGFDLTYDLLLKLAFKMDLFDASESIGLTEYSGNKFNFTKDLSSGYFNSASYIMQYEDMRIKQAKL